MSASTTSPLGIMNLALVKLGSPIAVSATDNTKEARTANLLYPIARDNILAEHDWKCATDRAQLAPSSSPPLFNFANAFPLPVASVRVIDIYPQYYDWKVEGRNIYCDLDLVNLRFVSNEKSVTEFSALLVNAIASELAFLMCPTLLQSDADSITDKLEKRRDKALIKAKNNDSKEQSLQGVDSSYLYDSRFAGNVYGAPFQNVRK